MNNNVRENLDKNIVTIVSETCNNINVIQPQTTVIEILTGPKGNTGAVSTVPGPSGSSAPFTYVTGSIWNTTSSIEISGSFTVSGSSTFKNIGPAIFSGSVDISSSLTVTGSLSVTGSINGNFTGSLLGTSSYALNASTASYALTSSFEFSSSYSSTSSFVQNAVSSSYASTASFLLNNVPPFPYTGSAAISGSLLITGSLGVRAESGSLINFGNATTASQRLVRIGQDTAWIDFGSYTGLTSLGAIYANITTPGSSNYSFVFNTTGLILNTPATNGIMIFRNANVDAFSITGVTTSGANKSFLFTIPAHTNQTLSTNIPNFQVTGNNKQWATGDIINQYWNYFTANTASFVGNSTITSSYGLYVEAAAIGTSASILNNYAIGTSGSIRISDGSYDIRIGGGVSPYNTYSTIFMGQSSPSTSNFTFRQLGTSLNINAPAGGDINFGTGGTSYGNLSGAGWIFNPPVAGASFIPFTFTVPASTSKTASTNIPIFKITGNNVQWSTGNITAQYWNYLSGNTASFVGSSVITSSYGLFVEEAIGGISSSITNNFAIGTNGFIQMSTGSDSITLGNAAGYGAAFWGSVTSRTSTNWILSGDASDSRLNGVSNVYLMHGGTIRMQLVNTRPSGITNSLIWSLPSHTGQTTTAEISGVLFNSYSREWTAGNIPIQREHYIKPVTYTATSSSLITNTYGLYVEAPTMGTSMTASNIYAAGFNGKIQIQSGSISGQGIIIGNLFGSTTNSALYMGVTPSSTNFTIRGDTAGNTFINGGQVFLAVGGTSQMILDTFSVTFQSFIAATSGTKTSYTFNSANHTNQASGSEIPGVLFNSYNRIWQSGSIPIQREKWIKTVSYFGNGPTFVTSSYGLYVEAPTIGALFTSYRNFAAGFSGSIEIQGNADITGSINISGSLKITASSSLELPLTSSIFTPGTGSIYFSGSFLFVWNGTRYMSASLA